jgi:hypothetical protein
MWFRSQSDDQIRARKRADAGIGDGLGEESQWARDKESMAFAVRLKSGLTKEESSSTQKTEAHVRVE